MQVSKKYIDYIEIFFKKTTIELPEHIKINDHFFNQEEDKQPPYRLIYNLKPVELEMLKTYIKNNLKNLFIRPSKSHVGVSILFVKKVNSFLQLYIDYQELNKLTIKNWYPLLFIDKSIDRLGRPKHFMQLD